MSVAADPETLAAIPPAAGRGVLLGVRGRLRGLWVVGLVLTLAGALALATLGAILTDALLVLPPGIRAGLPWLLAAIALAALGAGLLLGRRLTERRVARLLESRDPSLGTKVTLAVELAERRAENPVRELLRRRAVEAGRERSRDLTAWPVARDRVLVGLGVAVAAAALWTAGPALFGGLFSAVWPRFLDPWGDHPPWSRVSYTVEPADPEALWGGDCEIRVRTSGPPVEKLTLLAEGAHGRSSTLMLRHADGHWLQTLTNLREETRFWVTDGRGRSRRHTIRIRYTPRIERVRITLEFPPHTRLEKRTEDLAEDAISVPARTLVVFAVDSNRPLASGTLRLVPLLGGDPAVVRLVPDPDRAHRVFGGFSVERSVAFALDVEDTSGLSSTETRQGRLEVRPDRRPTVHVLEPRPRALATPDATIPVRVRAEDDWGVERLLWFRGLNDSVEVSVDLEGREVGSPARVLATTEFRLGSLGVRPGDRIECFAEAVDNDPDGPQIATSRLGTIEIISLEEYRAIRAREEMRDRLLQEYVGLARHLRRVLEQARALRAASREADAASATGREPDTGGEPSGDTTPRPGDRRARSARELAEALEGYRSSLRRLLERRPGLPVEEEIHRTLERQSSELERLARRARDLASRSGASPGSPEGREELESLVADLERLFGTMEEEVERPAVHVAEVGEVLTLAGEFVRLTERQKAIARHLRRFEDARSPPGDGDPGAGGRELSRLERMELRELEGEEESVREGLRRLLEELPRRTAELPEEEAYDGLRTSVDEFVDAVAEAGIEADLESAAGRLARLDGRGALPPARDAAEKMDALISKCSGMGRSGSECCRLAFRPSLSQAIGATLEQLLAALFGQPGGGSGGAGVGRIGRDVGLYGPEAMLTGAARGGGEDLARPTTPDAARRKTSRPPAPEEGPADPSAPTTARLRLDREARFPLRYRTLVGEYFRAMAESLEEEAQR